MTERDVLTPEQRVMVESYRKQAAALDGFPGTRAGLGLVAIIDALCARLREEEDDAYVRAARGTP